MRTAAILPVKSFGRAKQRLGAAFPDRPRLAGAMLADVLEALGRADGLDDLIVVSAERVDGAFVVHDPVEAGQSAAAALGIAAAVERGAERVLLVPGDCPTLDPDELRALLAHDEDVVIVPDRHGAGTNALLLAPPDAIAPAFGPGSFARHAALARAAGARVKVCELRSLGLDVDTPDDLAALRRALAERPQDAPRTRALLAHPELSAA
jgi:2-phospho-L-lactate/phosphoenolpyruvate guanylyltransferase